MLRDYINAKIGFQRLPTDIDETPENVMHMLSTTGNSGPNNLMSQLEPIGVRHGFFNAL